MHIGFIMDGNRRWAKNNLLKSFDGHRRGLDQFEQIVQDCLDRDIAIASFWALAKKNILERSSEELTYLYELIEEMVVSFRVKAAKDGIRFLWVGNRSILPTHIVDLLDQSEKETAHHANMSVVVAVGYGGQDEIIEGIRSFVASGASLDSLNEESFASHLMTGKVSSPDLIIRTGGTLRTSGYWLYGSEYSEWYFSDKYWPEFDSSELDKALLQLQGAKRNFGK